MVKIAVIVRFCPTLLLQSYLQGLSHTPYTGRAEFRCLDCGHVYLAGVKSKLSRMAGCPCCTGAVVVPGLNDLASARPDLAAQWHPGNDK